MKDGGPAFPIPIEFCPDYNGKGGVVVDASEYHPRNGGMTLRDYFAAHAPQSEINREQAEKIVGREAPNDIVGFSLFASDAAAKMAYQFADAMLVAREAAAFSLVETDLDALQSASSDLHDAMNPGPKCLQEPDETHLLVKRAKESIDALIERMNRGE